MANLVGPTPTAQERISEMYVIRTTSVRVDWKTETFEVWDAESKTKKRALAKSAIDRVAQASGVSWDPALTGVIGKPSMEYLMYRAVGGVVGPDGGIVVISGTVEWHYSLEVQPIVDDIAELEAKIAAGDKSCEKALYGKKKQLIDVQKYRIGMCESKAKNRAVRGLGIKAKYTIEELNEPFVVQQVCYAPDITSPDVKEVLKARVDMGRNALYGNTAATPAITAGAPALMAAAPDEEYEDVPLEVMAGMVIDEDVVEAEVVEEGQRVDLATGEVFSEDDIPDPNADFTDDPADFIIHHPTSDFNGQTLAMVESAKPGYAAFCWGHQRGNPEFLQACRAYLGKYQSDNPLIEEGDRRYNDKNAPEGGE